MKIFMVAIILLFGYSAIANAEARHRDKQIAVIQSPDDRPCLFFVLSGVSEADPIVSGMKGSEWFAVPHTHQGYREILGLLIAARISAHTVTVITTGNVVCGGYGEVKVVRL